LAPRFFVGVLRPTVVDVMKEIALLVMRRVQGLLAPLFSGDAEWTEWAVKAQGDGQQGALLMGYLTSMAKCVQLLAEPWLGEWPEVHDIVSKMGSLLHVLLKLPLIDSGSETADDDFALQGQVLNSGVVIAWVAFPWKVWG
jgi:hypothetical protein